MMNATLDLNDREHRIFSAVADLSTQIEGLDEATLDAHYYFRFDPIVSERMSEIRVMTRGLLGLGEDDPVGHRTSVALLLHLWQYVDLRVAVESSPEERAFRIIIPKNREAYHPFDAGLREEMANLPLTAPREKVEALQRQLWAEANQVVKVLGEIKRLGIIVGLVPSECEMFTHAPVNVAQRFWSWLSWVILAESSPSFPWRVTRLVEQETGRGIERAIRPRAWDTQLDGEDPTTGQGQRMSPNARIRTWAIYYFSRRGGGRRTEEKAIELWQFRYPAGAEEGYPSPENFRKQRIKLFRRGTKKRV